MGVARVIWAWERMAGADGGGAIVICWEVGRGNAVEVAVVDVVDVKGVVVCSWSTDMEETGRSGVI